MFCCFNGSIVRVWCCLLFVFNSVAIVLVYGLFLLTVYGDCLLWWCFVGWCLYIAVLNCWLCCWLQIACLLCFVVVLRMLYVCCDWFACLCWIVVLSLLFCEFVFVIDWFCVT